MTIPPPPTILFGKQSARATNVLAPPPRTQGLPRNGGQLPLPTPDNRLPDDRRLKNSHADSERGTFVSLTVRPRQVYWSLLGVVLLSVSQVAHATFSLTFQGTIQTINTGGSITLSSPSGIVVDPAGDIFIADTVSGSGRIVEVNAQGVASVLAISGLSPALGSLSGIAIDGAGDLYIADTSDSRVVKVTPAGVGSVVSTPTLTLTAPQGVALDQSGDIFIADTGNSRIIKVTSGGTAAVITIAVSSGVSTLSSPKGLAVGSSGQLYNRRLRQQSCRDCGCGKHYWRRFQHRPVEPCPE